MSEGEQTYRANVPAVAHETFDDEAILIHFESGRYYSLNATGRAIWAALVGGATLTELVIVLVAQFAADEATLRASIAPFLGELEAQGLIVPAQNRSAVPARAAGAAAPAAPRAPFVAPHVDVFSDMQDLLLLDPIHDVDEAGWPHGRE